MVTSFSGINLSSKDPQQLALFYRDILGIPMFGENPGFDGVTFGNSPDTPVFWIWDENKWGTSSTGSVLLVFQCDDHDKTYAELCEKGVVLDPPETAVWGGKELHVTDPDGNRILIL